MYAILPHTADIRVRLTTASLASLFREASEALAEVARPMRAPGSGETRTLTVESHDATSLLVDFLNELLWLLEVRRLTPNEITIVELTGERLVASIAMDAVEGWERDIKAVTYHEAEIRCVAGEWSTTLVFDI